MATIAPWFSATGDRYHIRDECVKSAEVLPENRNYGPRPARVKLCQDCLLYLIREFGQETQ